MESAYSLYVRGIELLDTGNPAQAAVVLERARALEPEKASIRESLGRAYFNYGELEMAKEHFEKALELHPTDHFAHFCVALCHKRQGNLILARKHLKLALAMEPDSKQYQQALNRVLRS